MRLLFFAVVRLLMVVAVLITALAVVIGRAHRGAEGAREAAPAQIEEGPYRAVNSTSCDSAVRVLDVGTGVVERMEVSRSDIVHFAACSPWRDGAGRTHVVAQWRGHGEEGGPGLGLARFVIPGGAILDRVVMDLIPSGSPCWFPDGSARVLFAASDGRLYHVTFEEGDGGTGPAVGGGRADPSPLAWPPAILARTLHISDPTWPSDPRFADLVLATVIERGPGDVPPERRRTRLWWLRIDPRRPEVVAAGKLIEPEPAAGHREGLAGEYLGTVSVTPDGGLVLAYLVRQPRTLEIRLRLVPLRIDPATGAPRTSEADAVELAGGRAFSPPAFSKDGLWLYSFPNEPTAPARAERSSVVAALSGRRRRSNAPATLVAALPESPWPGARPASQAGRRTSGQGP
jgi:hypothetical protein